MMSVLCPAMARLPPVSVWVMAAIFSAGSGLAADRPPVLKEPAPIPPPAPARVISPAAAAARLAAVAPKYDPAAPVRPAEPAPDLRETDKPRNTIIRLPRYVVEEEKPLVLPKRQLPTPRARLEIALKKFPGLRLGSFWIFRNDGVALAMLAEEERLERMKEMNELVTLLPAAEQKRVKPMVDQAFMRR